jgi:gliding motility-associated lipoprotein GldK
MKNVLKLALGLLVVFSTSCGKQESGELTGVLDRPSWSGINPYGMVYVPSGTLMIGPSDQDVNSTFVQRPKTVSIVGFFMDETEITNNEYRQFVYWVRDEMAHRELGHVIPDEKDPNKEVIDWEQELDWENDEQLREAGFYFTDEEKLSNREELNPEKLKYTYKWYDWQAAAHNADKTKKRSEFFKSKEVPVYPDEMVWVRDFSYSYNEPMTRNYFWHPAYDDYPVVGVNWHMASAFSYWRTQLYNAALEGEKEVISTEDFRLPTEHEWEYAARGGHENSPYPWGGPYIRNAKGCLLANFKPGRGNYPEDGGYYTVKADAYFPNDYGLYNMAGNVSEWTSTAFHENAYSFIHDLNPDYRYDADDEKDNIADKRKVIRGGSWKDVHYFLQTGTRDWEYQDTTKSYVGFRNVLTFLGRSINDF